MYGNVVKQRDRDTETQDATFGGTWQWDMQRGRWASVTGLAAYYFHFKILGKFAAWIVNNLFF